MRRYQWKRRKRLEAQQSTVTEPSVSGTVKTSARSAGIGKQAAVAGGIAAGILAAAYMGGALFFQSHFLPNTTVNGTDFSGRSAGALRSYMKEKIDGYELSILGKEGSSDTIRGSDIALSYEGNEEAERLLKKQNAFLWPGAFFTENAARIENGVSYDAELLDEKLQTLKAVTEEQTEILKLVNKENVMMLTGGAGCVDCDTEFFNGQQWKRIADYQDGDAVLLYLNWLWNWTWRRKDATRLRNIHRILWKYRLPVIP